MKNFARHWIDPTFTFSSLLFVVVAHVSLLVGTMLGLIFQSWIAGLIVGFSLIVFVYLVLVLVWYANKRCVIAYFLKIISNNNTPPFTFFNNISNLEFDP